jgi:hypothetical protein
MKKYLIFAFVAASLFVSLGLNLKAVAGKNEPVILGLAATPKPKIWAHIERIEFDKREVLIGCPPDDRQRERSKDPNSCDYYGTNQIVAVKTLVSNPKNVPITYQYTVSGGRIRGEGANVTWDLSGVRPKDYTITVAIKGKSGVSEVTQTNSITLRECEHCFVCICPTLEITGSKSVRASESVAFTAKLSGGTTLDISYNWTISQGEIVSGQGTPQIKVKTTPEMTGNLQVTLEIQWLELCSGCSPMTTKTVEITK